MNIVSKILILSGIVVFVCNMFISQQWIEILAISMVLFGFLKAKEDFFLWFDEYKALKFYSLISFFIALIFVYWFL